MLPGCLPITTVVIPGRRHFTARWIQKLFLFLKSEKWKLYKCEVTTIVLATQKRRNLCVSVFSLTQRFEMTFMSFLSAFLQLCLNAAEAGWGSSWQLVGYRGLSKASSEESSFLTPNLAEGLMFWRDLSPWADLRIMQRKSGSKPVASGGKWQKCCLSHNSSPNFIHHQHCNS